MTSAFRRTILLLATGPTFGCVHVPAPPALMVANRTWAPSHSGYVFRAGYFTDGEASDERWEIARIQMMLEQGSQCRPGRTRIVRRDIRWYPATPLSGRRCAAFVYTVSCGAENGLVQRSADEVRRQLLAAEPARPIAHDCGDKDYYAYHPEDCPRVQYRPAGCLQHRRRELGLDAD